MLSVYEKACRRAERTRYTLKKRNRQGLPRFSVYRSGSHIYVQLIDDAKSQTLISASSLQLASKNKKVSDVGGAIKAATCVGARHIGKLAGEAAIKAGITAAIFDKGSYRFHGRVKALAEGAQEAGLRFSGEAVIKDSDNGEN